MIDVPLVIYGLLVLALVGLAIRLDARRRKRLRQADNAAAFNKANT